MSGQTIIVKFGESVSDPSALFVVELDDTLNLDTDGEIKGQFYPGDQIFFLMHYDAAKLRITAIKTTDGQVVVGRQVTREKTIELLFDDPATPQELPHLPSGAPVTTWYGRTSTIARAGRRLTAAATPCIGDITYQYQATSAKLLTPNIELEAEEEYPIAVVIYVEAAL